jgi:predicted peptidase
MRGYAQSSSRPLTQYATVRLFFFGIAGVLLAGLASNPLLAQERATGFLDRDMGGQGEGDAYQVYLPRSFDLQSSWPLVVYLHGLGAGGSDGIKPTEGGLGDAIRQNPEWFPTPVLFPQAPADSNWEGEVADRVLRQIDATIAEFHLDPDRVYLTGASMGGEGVYYIATRHASRFAALVVSCGSPFTPAWRLEDLGLPPVDRTTAAFDEVARALQHLPLWAFHGNEDTVVDVREARATKRAMEAAGADARLTEYPGFGHDACAWAFFEEDLWPWLFAQRRSRE